MLIVESWDLSVEECFFAFFLLSFALLALICLAGLPGLLKGAFRQYRLLSARSRRGARTLADKGALLALSRRIEGLYYFEDPSEAPAGGTGLEVDAAPSVADSRERAPGLREGASHRSEPAKAPASYRAEARRRAPDAA